MAGGGTRNTARTRAKSSSTSDKNDTVSTKSNLKSLRNRNAKDQSLIQIFNINLKTVFIIGLISFLVILLLINNLINYADDTNKLPRVITPFPAPKLTDLPQFQGQHKESLYWGTYRPNVYFGVRARTPKSLLVGLMWIGMKEGRYFMRHVCQDSDELSKYGWMQHNGRDFGHQEIFDHGLKLETSFLKFKSEGSGYGGDWAVRIGLQSDESNPNSEILKNGHLFLYLADENGNALNLGKDEIDINQNSLLALGSRADVGDWQLHLELKDVLEIHYSGFRTPHIHNLSDLVQYNLGTQVRSSGQLLLSDSIEESSNILVFQISSSVPFKTDIAFVSGTGEKNSRVKARVNSLTGTSLTSQLQKKQSEFDAKFKKCFNMADKLESKSIIVGKAAIANMLGGIGYYYGQSKISYPKKANQNGHDNFIAYWPAELYTAVPSRPFFPRGFLWDEGFHQLLIWRWDVTICLDILSHWLDLMNIDGWIPREQILGSEALSKVPGEFVAQLPTNGNPPTLFLVISDLLHGMKENKFTPAESSQITSFLERAFVRLEAWFQWFNITQSGKESGSYFWHGRDNSTTRELNPKTLSSGLDDYPRASHPSEDERHLDLRCWMLLASNCMSSIQQLLDKEHKFDKDYSSTAKLLSDFEMLNQMHLDPIYGTYFDYGNHTEKVRLSWKETIMRNDYVKRDLVREVLERPELRLVPHVGYVSLFPFMRKIIPSDSWILEKQLDLISSKSILWTDYGLRSLARTSSIYMKRNTEHDPPYWRGPIWMNMNYLVLSALDHYSKEDGPYRDKAKKIYEELRSNLMRNVVQNYEQTGFLWEQYDQKKGKGKGARLFTGWTALILLIMAEAYA